MFFGSPDNPTGDEDPDFARFWQAYPAHKRQAKLAARRIWYQLRPDKWLVEQIMQALAWQVKQLAWREESGKYVPRADRWLRDGRWMDERPPAQQPASPAHQPWSDKWMHECCDRHDGECLNQKQHEARKQREQGI